MTADVLCDEGVVKQSARVQLRRRAIFPAAGDGGGKTILASTLRADATGWRVLTGAAPPPEEKEKDGREGCEDQRRAE